LRHALSINGEPHLKHEPYELEPMISKKGAGLEK